MNFSLFTKVVSGNVIYFRNDVPIENVGSLKFYTDDSDGIFLKKEFRWSSDRNNWSSWIDLSIPNLSKIIVSGNPYLYLEAKYTMSSPNAGSVSTFTLEYLPLTGAVYQNKFRWTFDKSYWSSWENIDAGNLSKIQVDLKKYLYVEAEISSNKVLNLFLDYPKASYVKQEFRWSANRTSWSDWTALTLTNISALRISKTIYVEILDTLSVTVSTPELEASFSDQYYTPTIEAASLSAEKAKLLETAVRPGQKTTTSNFSRTVFGDTITFRNENPLEYVDSILSYRDDSNGVFSRKEFRWSFDKTYWSLWAELNVGNIARVDCKYHKSLYLEIRYVTTSGTVNKFYLDYLMVSGATMGSQVDNVTTKVINITNADTLDDKSPDFYLYRKNHKGSQSISTITGLEESLMGIRSIFNYYMLSSSTGLGLYWANGVLNVAGGTISRDYVDGSLYARDLSINQIGSDLGLQIQGIDGSIIFLNLWNLSQDASIVNLKTYIDGSLNQRDLKIEILDSSILELRSIDLVQDASFDNIRVYIDGSINTIAKWNITIDSSIIELQNRIKDSDSSIVDLQSTTQNLINYKIGGAYNAGLGQPVYNSQDVTNLVFNTIRGLGPIGVITELDGQTIDITLDISIISKEELDYYIKNSSTGIGLYWNNGKLDVSIATGTTDDVTKTYVDGSLSYYIKSTSTGVGLYWNNGKLDVSVASGGVTKEYIDGSLSYYIRSSSTGVGLYWNNGKLDVSIIAGDVTKAYVDGSLAVRDSSISSNTVKLNYTDASSLQFITSRYNESFAGTIKLDRLLTHYSTYAVSSSTNILLDSSTSKVIGSSAEIRLVANGGTVTFDPSLTKSPNSMDYDISIGKINWTTFYFNGVEYLYSISILN